ncbi:glycosyl transferase [Rhizobium sp. YIM 134829]|uniref:glycosyl transferase n=1 Tax=Rhizobium sp. YIM 134829 TaxID=3390453 RepID=UPI00397A7C78
MASDRPLNRKVVKLAVQLLRGRSSAHYYDRFPGLMLRREADGSGAILYRGLNAGRLLPSDALNRFAGEEITIVGSGPSAGQAAYSRLPPRSALLLNGALVLAPARIRAPLAVAIEDDRFVYRHFDRFLKDLDATLPCLLSVSAIRALLEQDRHWLSERPVILIDNILKPYGARRRRLADLAGAPDILVNPAGTAGLSRNPGRGVFQAGSVAVSALQFALACRPRQIGFIGVDITNASQPRFYESNGESAFSGIADAEARILEHMLLGMQLAEESDIVLVNYSPVSALAKCGLPFNDRLMSA